MTQSVLTIEHVSKQFGRFQALDQVSFTVEKGDIYGLIGENGAGKTTLMRLITGLSPMQHGTVTLLGEQAGHYQHALSRIGAVIESPAAFEKLTVYQNLRLCAIQHGIQDKQAITEAIDFVGLKAKQTTKVKHLSLGQKQRLGLALAILPRPDFLILDEPINGLDPSGIMEFRQLLKRLNEEQQTTILISSHILSELYQVSTRFGIIHHGRMIKQLTKAELDKANQSGLAATVDDTALAAQVLDQHGYQDFDIIDDHHLLLRQPEVNAAGVNQLRVTRGVGVQDISHQAGSLEQFYMQLLGQTEKQEGQA